MATTRTMPDGTTYTYEAVTTVTVEVGARMDANGITLHCENKQGDVLEVWFTTTAIKHLHNLAVAATARRKAEEQQLLL